MAEQQYDPSFLYSNADLAYLPYFKLMAGDKPPDDFLSNGCSYSPDVVFGNDLRPAAHFHDYHYSQEHREQHHHDERARYQADQLFRLNLRSCGLRLLAVVYYCRVRLWGHMAYQYNEGAEPHRTPWWWLKLAVGRHIQW